jgi:SulP family sulfate permease
MLFITSAVTTVKSFKSEWKYNWKSGLSVALVNIPMSLSLAIASGASPTAGVITAIWAGLVGAIFGGSHFNVVGPAGALSGILAGYALMYGPGVLPIVALISGIMILGIWALKWERYIVFIPSSVVHGFTLSVALVIALGQLNSALGLKGLPAHEKLLSNIWESILHINQTQLPTFAVFLAGLALMFAIFKYKPTWPNSIIVAVIGIGAGALGAIGKLSFTLDTLQTKYGTLHLALFSMPHLDSSMFSLTVLKAVPLVAIIVILETILSAKVADGMTKTRFNQSKEVLGIGLANIVSGLFGGLPATGVFARTALNIRSGAKSRYSSIINVFGVILISLVLLQGFSYLPLAIVASILVFLSFRMVTKEHFANLYKFDKTAFGISLAVAALSIVYDPLIGILAGSAVSLMVFVNFLSKSQCELVVGKVDKHVCDEDLDSHLHYTTDKELDLEEVSANVLIYRFVGELNYINSERYKELTHKITGDQSVIFNLKNLFYVDVDGLDALDEIIEELETRNVTVYLSGVSKYLQPLFMKKEWYEEKVKEGHVVSNTKDAINKIKTGK